MPHYHVRYCLRETMLRQSHDLDGKIAGILNKAFR